MVAIPFWEYPHGDLIEIGQGESLVLVLMGLELPETCKLQWSF